MGNLLENIISAALLSLVLLYSPCKSDDNISKDNPKPECQRVVQVYAPYFSFGLLDFNISSIPDKIRTAQAYTGVGERILDKNISYFNTFVGAGIGVGFFDRIRFDAEYIYASAGSGNRHTFSEKDFQPRDEYVGYVVNNDMVSLSFSVKTYYEIYLKGTYGINLGEIISGSDAFAKFTSQYYEKLPNEAGGTISFKPVRLAVGKKEPSHWDFSCDLGYMHSIEKKDGMYSYRIFTDFSFGFIPTDGFRFFKDIF
jgi:hypothetical protein